MEERRLDVLRRAQLAARTLHDAFPHARILGFGSTCTGHGFHRRSDIDVAVAGIPRQLRGRAWNLAVDAAGTEAIDGVLLEEVGERLRAAIERDGIAL